MRGSPRCGRARRKRRAPFHHRSCVRSWATQTTTSMGRRLSCRAAQVQFRFTVMTATVPARRSEPFAAAHESLRLYVPSTNEVTHPRCCKEGYPDGPGRASNKEGESWGIIAKPLLELIRQNCVMQWRSPKVGVVARCG